MSDESRDNTTLPEGKPAPSLEAHVDGSPSAGSDVDNTTSDSIDQKEVPHQPLETFHYFPNFPVEIRLKIWTFALSAPRLVVPFMAWRMSKDKKHKQDLAPFREPWPTHIVSYSSCDPLSALRISKETRELTLKRTFLFDTGCTRLYLDPSTDFLVFDHSFAKNSPQLPQYLEPCSLMDFQRFTNTPERHALKKLAVSAEWLNELAVYLSDYKSGFDIPWGITAEPLFKKFSALEEFTIRFDGKVILERIFLNNPGSELGAKFAKELEEKKEWLPHCGRCADAYRDLGSGFKGWRFPTFKEYEERFTSGGCISPEKFWSPGKTIEDNYLEVLKLTAFTDWTNQRCLVVLLWQWIHDGEEAVNLQAENRLALKKLLEV